MCSVLSTLSVREGRRKSSRVHVYWQAEHQAEGTRQTSLSLSVQQEGASGETIEGKLRKKWKILRPWWALLWSWVKDMHSPGSLVARAEEPHGFEEEGWSAPLLCLVYPHSTHQHGIRTSRCQVWGNSKRPKELSPCWDIAANDHKAAAIYLRSSWQYTYRQWCRVAQGRRHLYAVPEWSRERSAVVRADKQIEVGAGNLTA